VAVFALADLHLSFAAPKPMDVFGPAWVDHARRIAENWTRIVADGDVVLVAGDVSWAMDLEGARPDLEFLAGLPGRKVLVRGNHDYWWKSRAKMRAAFPEFVYLHADAARVEGLVIGGTRLWTHPAIGWGSRMTDVPPERRAAIRAVVGEEGEWGERAEDQRLWRREIARLDLALAAMEKLARPGDARIAVVHFPPLGPDLAPTEATRKLSAAGTRVCVFGHVHNLDPARTPSFDHDVDGVRYVCASGDLVGFTPVRVL
jgi:predicted phosphohydrolase